MTLFDSLPEVVSLESYNPLLVSNVFDREGSKIGEFSRSERRTLVNYEDIPKIVIQAFLAAEDASFFRHRGVNFKSLTRAVVANLKAGKKVQGGSTITQQVAKTIMLTNKKTYTRKIKEILLAYRMEQSLSKSDILYLYLNQIYLGQGAYGVAKACENYFRKPLQEISLAEAALLAGLTPAPSRYTPTYEPGAAKRRQQYVLQRMVDENYITEEQSQSAKMVPLQIFLRKNQNSSAPYYLEVVRQMIVEHLGEEILLDEGVQIYTGLDLDSQKEAQKQVEQGLRALDKRQGFRGPKKSLTTVEEVHVFLLESRNELMDEFNQVRQLQPDGAFPPKEPLNLSGQDVEGKDLPNIPPYLTMDQIIQGVVIEVSDKWGLVKVRFAENRGLIDIKTMDWARKPNPKIRWIYEKIKKPSQVLKEGDVIEVRIKGEKFQSPRLEKVLAKGKFRWKEGKRPTDLPEFHRFAHLELEQEPVVEGALLSVDQKSSDIIAMVGGYDFQRSKFNRTYQARRQTGSAFKTFVYAAALDHGYTAATPIIDAPMVFESEDEGQSSENEGQGFEEGDSLGDDGDASDKQIKKWKPKNHSTKFGGDILLRNAFVRSLNVPTIRIIEKLGVKLVADYAQRLGVSSPLNMDLTLALGSSGVTLYEMTKAFSHIANLGRRVRPRVIHRVVDRKGNILLENVSLDDRLQEDIDALKEKFEERRQAYLRSMSPNESSLNEPSLNEPPLNELNEPPLFFESLDQLVKPSTAYLVTSLLQGVVTEPRGTGGKARALKRPVAGKTGSTNGYFDGWFVGYTPDITTGVWVGYDNEKSLGKGEVGGNNALPIWLEYMKFVHRDLPSRNFSTPQGIVFANIDNETGRLASTKSSAIVKQAFLEGTEPSSYLEEEEDRSGKSDESTQDFLKEDMSG